MEVAFYKGRTRLLNRLISFWLRGDYSHVELVLGTDDAGMAICASSSIMDGGVRVKHMVLDPAHWDVVEVGGDARAAWAWLEAHEGNPYDYGGAVGFASRLFKQNQEAWFCSEAVAAMLQWPSAWRFDPCNLHAAITGQMMTRTSRA